MDAFLKMEIFFFVATLALFLVTILFVILLVYAIAFLRTAIRLAKLAEKEAEALAGDIESVRTAAVQEAGQFIMLITHARKFVLRLMSLRAPRE